MIRSKKDRIDSCARQIADLLEAYNLEHEKNIKTLLAYSLREMRRFVSLTDPHTDKHSTRTSYVKSLCDEIEKFLNEDES